MTRRCPWCQNAYDAKMPTRRHDPQQRADIVLGKKYFQKVLELWIHKKKSTTEMVTNTSSTKRRQKLEIQDDKEKNKRI